MMKPFSIASYVLVAGVLVANAASAVGQVAPSIGQGSRVRITAPSLGLEEAVGTVKEATDEALVVQFEFPRRVGTVDRSEIGKMDVSIQREQKVLKSAGVGLLLGAGAGAMLGLASGDDQGTFLAFTAEEKALMGGAALGLTGVVVGLIVGLVRRPDVWSPSLPGDVSLSVVPLVHERGAGLNVSLGLPFN
jgi:hypothetical protein